MNLKIHQHLFLSLLYFIALLILFFSINSLSFSQIQTLTLQDNVIKIDFDRKTGAVIGLHYKTMDIPFRLSSVPPKPLFEIKTLNALRDWITPPDQIKTITSGEAHLKNFVLSGDARSLELEYFIEPSITITCTIQLNNEGYANFGMRIDNARPIPHASEGLRIISVKYPQLSGLQHGHISNDDLLATSYLQGDLIPDPVKNAKSIRRFEYGYAGTMSWMDLHSNDCGLYFGSHEKRLYALDIIPEVDYATKSLTLSYEKSIFICPDEKWESDPYIVAFHPGDWHRGAEIYREWKNSYLKIGRVPKWAREVDGWYGWGGEGYTFSQLPKFLEISRWLGFNHVEMWAQMIFGSSYYSFWLPDPRAGGEEGLRNAIKKIKEMGGHIGFYTNGVTFDMNCDETLKDYTHLIPAGYYVPTWFRKFEFFNIMKSDGEYGHRFWEKTIAHPKYIEGFNAMCPASGWTDYLLWWIIERYYKDYGANAHYLDSLPGGFIGYPRTSVCYNLRHADRPHSVMEGCWGLYSKLLQKVNDPEYMLLSEFPSDIVIDKAPVSLGWETMGMNRPFRHPEIFTYTFPEWIFFSGTCNTQVGVADYYDDMTYATAKHEDSIDRVFLNGFRFDILGGFTDIPYNDPFMNYVKKVCAIRHKIKDDLYYSTFKDQSGLGELPKKVEARIWKKNDGNVLTINLLDRRPDKEEFDFTLNLDELNFTKVNNVTIYTFSGIEYHPQFNIQNNVLKFSIPKREGNCAAISIK